MEKEIAGRKYCIQNTSEGAAGSIYTQYTYATAQKGRLILLRSTIRRPDVQIMTAIVQAMIKAAKYQ
ncbi:MAG: hypothetical protein U5L00_17635 [Desulfovermiculus sp.]|nr:hypothetical protein [Desulfovermiculus sp.]